MLLSVEDFVGICNDARPIDNGKTKFICNAVPTGTAMIRLVLRSALTSLGYKIVSEDVKRVEGCQFGTWSFKTDMPWDQYNEMKKDVREYRTEMLDIQHKDSAQ
jgi:hypothetical protein